MKIFCSDHVISVSYEDKVFNIPKNDFRYSFIHKAFMDNKKDKIQQILNGKTDEFEIKENEIIINGENFPISIISKFSLIKLKNLSFFISNHKQDVKKEIINKIMNSKDFEIVNESIFYIDEKEKNTYKIYILYNEKQISKKMYLSLLESTEYHKSIVLELLSHDFKENEILELKKHSYIFNNEEVFLDKIKKILELLSFLGLSKTNILSKIGKNTYALEWEKISIDVFSNSSVRLIEKTEKGVIKMYHDFIEYQINKLNTELPHIAKAKALYENFKIDHYNVCVPISYEDCIQVSESMKNCYKTHWARFKTKKTTLLYLEYNGKIEHCFSYYYSKNKLVIDDAESLDENNIKHKTSLFNKTMYDKMIKLVKEVEGYEKKV